MAATTAGVYQEDSGGEINVRGSDLMQLLIMLMV